MSKKETKNAEQIFCTVVRVKEFIKLKYWYNSQPMYMEMPLTERNTHLKENDEIEITLLVKRPEPKHI